MSSVLAPLHSLSPTMAAPRTSMMGDLAFDNSRLTESWAFMYNFPHQPQRDAVNSAGTMNVGAKSTTDANFTMMPRVRPAELE